MYPVSANFHTLAIQDAPKTRVRIYFIGDGVDCWDDNDVQTNGTLLVGAVGDTDSNGRIGQDGITFTEIYNKDRNLEIGGTVSYQIEMTLLNTDGALNNFGFGRCKVYLDVYDSVNSAWIACPMGVFQIELPVKRKVQLVSCYGYDQMQILNETADTWWNGLDFSGGLTIANILNSMVAQLGLHLSSASSSAMVNSSLSYTTAPFDSVERNYRDILGWVAEATGTIARFNRDGELDMRKFETPQVDGNNIVINTNTTGNQCLSIDIAEYVVSKIDALTIKLTTVDQGVTVGSGTNAYTIMDNPFLYGDTVTIIQNKLTPIYNRLNGYFNAYRPLSARIIADWSIEAGDIIFFTVGSLTIGLFIFAQKMTWRGGYVVSEMYSTGDTLRPQVSSTERETYRVNKEMATKVGDNEIISKINQTPEAITIQASKVNLTGYVTLSNLSTAGQTTINGSNITTGSISADRIQGGIMTVGGLNDTNGYIKILDSTGNYSGGIGASGITIAGKEPSAQSHVAYNSTFPEGISIRDNTTSKQMLNAGFYVADSTDEYASIYLQGYDNGTQVSSAQLYAYPYSNGAYLLLTGPGGAITRLNSDGTYAGDLTMTGGNLTVGSVAGGVLDVVDRRCYKTLSSAGWYRAIAFDSGGATNSNDALGVFGAIIDVFISRRYSNGENEVHKVTLLMRYNGVQFVDETSSCGNKYIDKIRWNYKTSDTSKGYLDIHYNSNLGNVVCVWFNVYTYDPSNQNCFTGYSLSNVGTSPAGETTLATHDFIANGHNFTTPVYMNGTLLHS